MTEVTAKLFGVDIPMSDIVPGNTYHIGKAPFYTEIPNIRQWSMSGCAQKPGVVVITYLMYGRKERLRNLINNFMQSTFIIDNQKCTAEIAINKIDPTINDQIA